MLSGGLAISLPVFRNVTGLPRSACVPTWVRPRLFAGGVGYLRQENF
jgi:hypothetical protein